MSVGRENGMEVILNLISYIKSLKKTYPSEGIYCFEQVKIPGGNGTLVQRVIFGDGLQILFLVYGMEWKYILSPNYLIIGEDKSSIYWKITTKQN